MSNRFVYTDSDGREVRLAGQADLDRAVADGTITDDTLLFDEQTDELAPARAHEPYRSAVARVAGHPGAEPERPAEQAQDPEPLEAPDEPEEDLGLGLTLADMPVDEAVEETVRDFTERLERERRQELELIQGAEHDSLGMVSGDTVADLAQSQESFVPEPPPAERPAPEPPPRERPAPEPHQPPDVVERAAPLFQSPSSTWRESAPSPRRVGPRGFDRGSLRQVAMLAALVGVGAWGVADTRATLAAAEGDSEVLLLEESGSSEPLPDGMADVQESADGAFLDMRRGMDRIRSGMGIGEPPTAWLSGAYLADPASAPEVRDFWSRYGLFVDSIRSAEEELFRAGFAARLQQVGITGPVLSIRLARGLTEFRADRPRRDEVYGAMEDLSVESLSLDTWLRAVQGQIAYAGVRDDAVSMAPGLEAVALDPTTEAELDQRLSDVLDALDRVTGSDPAEARNLTGQALGELGGPDSGR